MSSTEEINKLSIGNKYWGNKSIEQQMYHYYWYKGTMLLNNLSSLGRKGMLSFLVYKLGDILLKYFPYGFNNMTLGEITAFIVSAAFVPMVLISINITSSDKNFFSYDLQEFNKIDHLLQEIKRFGVPDEPQVEFPIYTTKKMDIYALLGYIYVNLGDKFVDLIANIESTLNSKEQ